MLGSGWEETGLILIQIRAWLLIKKQFDYGGGPSFTINGAMLHIEGRIIFGDFPGFMDPTEKAGGIHGQDTFFRVLLVCQLQPFLNWEL